MFVNDTVKKKWYEQLPTPPNNAVLQEQLHEYQMVQDILEDYDFIAITERLDESLVVLQMLLGLTTHEILYVNARSSGSFSNGFPDRPCLYIIPSMITPGIGQFLESDEWKDTIRGDLLLYQAAYASLDRTIESLGRDEFNKNLQALQNGLKMAALNCKDRVVSLCTEAGERVAPQNTTCYIWSEGCEHECVDELNIADSTG